MTDILPESPDPAPRSNQPAIIGAAVVLVVAALAVWGLIAVARGASPAKPPAANSSNAAPGGSQTTPTPPAAQPAGACSWTPADAANNPNLKDVGTPPTSGEPRTGTATMTMTTSQGVIEIQIDQAKTPCTAASFAYLAGKKFFDGSKCHRLVTDGIFVLQCGDPSGTGAGGPTYEFGDENLPAAGAGGAATYQRGVVAMANRGPATNSSQFFINYKDGQLPPSYTPFGTVTKGMDVMDKIAQAGVAGGQADGPPVNPVMIVTLTYH